MQSIFLISKMYAKIKTQDNKKYDTSEKKFFEFIWLRRLMGYARFNGYAVSMGFARFNGCAVSMGYARFWVFMAAPFLWASPVSRFECLWRLVG